MKDALMKSPILVYPDPNIPNVLFTDAPRYDWSAVLIQEHASVIDGNTIKLQLHITYVSGLFQGSQLNWAALSKEAYAIYTAV